MADHPTALNPETLSPAALTPEGGHLAHHFDDLTQQREAAELGMWLFLATEFMFFGGLFLAYLVYRGWYPQEFAAGSHTMDVLLGTINTGVLLTSSLTMALSVRAAHNSHRRLLVGLLLATAVLGCVFLGIKAYEYHNKYEDGLIPFLGNTFRYSGPERPGMMAYFNLYFVMTGVHAFHMILGIAMLGVLAARAARGGFMGERAIVVHNVGLYWHFVDLVWVYLFPFFYLVAARGSGGAHS